MSPDDQFVVIITTLLRAAIRAGMSEADALDISCSLLHCFEARQHKERGFSKKLLSEMQRAIIRAGSPDDEVWRN